MGQTLNAKGFRLISLNRKTVRIVKGETPCPLLIFLLSFFLFQTTVGIAQTPQPFTTPLLEKGAPGFDSCRNEPEQAKDYWV